MSDEDYDEQDDAEEDLERALELAEYWEEVDKGKK